MALSIFKLFRKSFLGVDIGTSAIRVVELSKRGGGFKLENYGEVKTSALYRKESVISVRGKNLIPSNQDIAKAIDAVLGEAKITVREVNLTIPDFSSFFTSFELPSLAKKEIQEAVRYEAHHYIPLPMSEVALDWQIIEGTVSKHKSTSLKVLTVAIPKEVVSQYQQIATFCQLNLKFLEAEVFALSRAAIREKEKIVALLDLGAYSSTISIIEKGVVKTSHSFDISGNELTATLSRALNIDYEKAEKLKIEQGLKEADEKGELLKEIISPIIDLILVQFNKVSESFFQAEGKEVEKVILAGGSVLLPGLKEYFYDKIEKEIEIADPFKNISCPPLLEKTLKEIGPSYAIAVGAAMKGLM